jgi:hypothetical protein
MSEGHLLSRLHVADIVGLRIQELHTNGSLRGTQPLLRIDNREQAKRAPFQLDLATGRLHRIGCRSIPKGSRSALYGIWRIGKNDKPLACPRCKPMPKADDKTEDPQYPTDLLYGVLSVVNQFGGVLRERGQEYRTSRVGKLLGEQIENMYRGINERERNILDVVLTSLDALASTIRNLDADLHGPNGSSTNGNGAKPPGANGHDVEKDRPKKTRRRSKAARHRTTSQ